jgi:hypothetical protein
MKEGSSQEVRDDAPTLKYVKGTRTKRSVSAQSNKQNPTPKLLSIAPPEEQAGCHENAWTERSAALSIERSFKRLSKIDLRVDRACHERIEFHGGGNEYNGKWSEEETNILVAFARKNIIQEYGIRKRKNEEDLDSAKGLTTL